MTRFFVIALWMLMLLHQPGKAQAWKAFDYQNGDLLFQDLDCGLLCDAIKKVSPGINGKHFSHIGLVYAVGESQYVIEASGKDVHLTPLDTFLLRQTDSNGNPKVMVGRLKPAYARLNSRAVGFALQQRGVPYDEAFLYRNGKFYCSELIQAAYQEANQGVAFFHLYPMTFKDPATGKTMETWKAYYKKLGIKIPEGKPGCNPGSIAISNNIDIVVSFY